VHGKSALDLRGCSDRQALPRQSWVLSVVGACKAAGAVRREHIGVTCCAAMFALACGARSSLSNEGALDASDSSASPRDARFDGPDAEPPDGAHASDDASPDVAGDSKADCGVLLTAGTVSPNPSSCWIDQKVGNQAALLHYRCGGGTAAAQFAVTFEGTVLGGQVELTATTEFVWSDGCSWQSEQIISGQLASGGLQYTYREYPIRGSNCAVAYCTASTRVLVVPTE